MTPLAPQPASTRLKFSIFGTKEAPKNSGFPNSTSK
jgi:hypothetical protein